MWKGFLSAQYRLVFIKQSLLSLIPRKSVALIPVDFLDSAQHVCLCTIFPDFDRYS